MAEARNDLIPSPATPPDQPAPAAQATPDILYDPQRIPALISFLRRTGLGFVKETSDGCATENPETDDLDVGPIGHLSLDLDI